MISQEFQLPQKEPILEMYWKAVGTLVGPPEAEEQSLEKTGTKGLWNREADICVAAETPRPGYCYNFSSLLKLRSQTGRDWLIGQGQVT